MFVIGVASKLMFCFTKRVGIDGMTLQLTYTVSTISVMKHSETAENSLNELLQDTSSDGMTRSIMDQGERGRLSRSFLILSLKCLLNDSASSGGET